MADPALVDQILATIRQRESGGNYTVKNPHSSASGAYQFIDSTWRGLGGGQYAPTARQATKAQQDAIARAYVERILDANGGRIDAVPRSWYVGNPNAPDSMQPGGRGNEGMTVGRYVNGWMSSFNNLTGGNYETGSGTVSAAGYSSASSDQSPEDYAKQSYGYLAAFLEHPEIGPILREAAAGKWSEDRLRGALGETSWWQNTNESARMFMAEAELDPEEQRAKINARAAQIMDRADQLGFPISRERAMVVAHDSVKFGWIGSELDRAIGNEVAGQNITQTTFGQRLRQTQRAYGVPMSDFTLDQWAQRIARGDETEEAFNVYIQGMAKSLYPQLSGAIDGGSTVDQFFDPYRQIAAQTLEISPESIDLSDPKWMSALAITDRDGNRGPMTLGDWSSYLRTNERFGFQNTKQANDAAEEFGDRFARLMGRIA